MGTRAVVAGGSVAGLLAAKVLSRWYDEVVVLDRDELPLEAVHRQGMTIAALAAEHLAEVLENGDDQITRRYFTGMAKLVDTAWVMSTSNDRRFDATAGKQPLAARLLVRYLSRLHKATATDAVVGRQFLEVVNLLAEPPSLLKPTTLLRVLRSS